MSKISIDLHQYGSKLALSAKQGCEIFKGIAQALDIFSKLAHYEIEVVTVKPVELAEDNSGKTSSNVLVKIVIVEKPGSFIEAKFESEFYYPYNEHPDRELDGLAKSIKLLVTSTIYKALERHKLRLLERQELFLRDVSRLAEVNPVWDSLL